MDVAWYWQAVKWFGVKFVGLTDNFKRPLFGRL